MIFSDGEPLSNNSFSFSEDAIVCMRAPYGECQSKKCERISEGQFALDVSTSTNAGSMIFSRNVILGGDGSGKTAIVSEGCVSLRQNTQLTFVKFDESSHTIKLGMEILYHD